MQLKHVNRIVCGLSLLGLTLALAGCGGGGGGRNFTFKPRPDAVNTYFETSPDTPYTGKIYATSPETASSTNTASLTYAVNQKPQHGTLTIDSTTGAFTYTPNAGYSGPDSFSYTAASASGSSAPGAAYVVVNGGNPKAYALGVPVYVDASATVPSPATVAVAVRLSNPPNGMATVDYTTVDGTAKAGSDYTAESGTLTFGPGVTKQTITIPLSDKAESGYRYFRVRLRNPSANLSIGSAVANVVMRYWPEPLNDTATTGCGTNTNGNPTNPDTCPQTGYPRQDAEIGRDPAAIQGTLVKAGYGGYTYDFSYDFTKIGFNGKPLLNQAVSYSVEPWACLRDNWTGLEWEVPRPAYSYGLYDSVYTYTWYDPDGQTNGGQQGRENGGAYKMDTHHFVQAANNNDLCQHSDWRLPTASELRNLVNTEANAVGQIAPAGIAPLPTLNLGGYWTSISDPLHPSRAVVISSTQAYDSFLPKSGGTGAGGGYHVILVRGGVQ